MRAARRCATGSWLWGSPSTSSRPRALPAPSLVREFGREAAPGGFPHPAPLLRTFIRHKRRVPGDKLIYMGRLALCAELWAQRPSGEQSSQWGGAPGCL